MTATYLWSNLCRTKINIFLKAYLRLANAIFIFRIVSIFAISFDQVPRVTQRFRPLQIYSLHFGRRATSPSDRLFPIQFHKIRTFPWSLNQIASASVIQRGKLISICAIQQISCLLCDVHVTKHALIFHGHTFHAVTNFRVLLQRHHVTAHGSSTWLLSYYTY